MSLFLADSSLAPEFYIGRDFTQYCEAVDALRAGRPSSINPHRSELAARLPGLLSERLGILDALSLSALLSTAAMLAGLYLWAWTLHSRTAAVAALFFAAALAPLVLLTRTLSFYPQSCAGIVLAGATSALAMRYRSPPWLVLAGLAAGFSVLLNPQGIGWALPAIGVTCLAALLPAPRSSDPPRTEAAPWPRRASRNLCWVLLSVALTWWAGRFVYSSDEQGSLESETFHYVEALQTNAEAIGLETMGVEPCHSPAEQGFIWGRASPLKWIPAIRCLHTLHARIPVTLAQVPGARREFGALLQPWTLPLLLGLLVTIYGLRKRADSLWGLLPNLVPYGLALSYTPVDPSLRRLAIALAAAPVVLGIAFAVLLGPGSDKTPSRRIRKTLLSLPRTWPAWLGLTLLISGILPSPLSPTASWRAIGLSGPGLDTEPLDPASPPLSHQGCKQALEADRARGIPPFGWLGEFYQREIPP